MTNYPVRRRAPVVRIVQFSTACRIVPVPCAKRACPFHRPQLRRTVRSTLPIPGRTLRIHVFPTMEIGPARQGDCMSTTTPTDRDQSFAETALRLGGKSDEEARRTGTLDKADEQVEALFAPQYQTVNSPIHKAVWEGKTPLDLFNPPPLSASAPCDGSMELSIDVVRRRHEAGTLYDERGKVSEDTFAELGQVGYWGMLIDPKYG